MLPEKKIPLIDYITDLLVALRGIWFLLILNLLAFFALFITPQGTDMMLSIIEDTGHAFITDGRIVPLLCLLIVLLFWSIASEFCTRFIMYLSDSSGRSLSPGRVDNRKRLQTIIARVSLFYPFALTILAFIKAFFFNYSDLSGTDKRIVIITLFVIIVLLLLEVLLMYTLYIRNWISRISKKYKYFSWLTISPKESYWVKKLYGILNDVRVSIPAADATYSGKDLPRDQLLPDGMNLPDTPYFVPYPDNPQQAQNVHVWMFKIKLAFYTSLFRQLSVLVGISFFLIIAFSFFIREDWYMWVGSTALLCLAIACWQVINTSLLFLDKAYIFPFRVLLLALFLITTIFNKDHPVRTLAEKNHVHKEALATHFTRWFDHLQQSLVHDTASNDACARIAKHDSIPVIFIAAEGGALRTGAFTAMYLSALQDSFPCFNKYIYCYSTVSGGTLGANYFNAVSMNHALYGDTMKYKESANKFFRQDFLSAGLGKLLFGEIINYFIPWHIPRLDRAIALEKSWELGWDEVYRNNPSNILHNSFNNTVSDSFPALFINTTEAETGLQCVWSNVDIQGIPFGRQRDLYIRTGKELPYSTAIGLSTRFPLISPGAAFFYGNQPDNDGPIRRHFVDGGYYENKGAETLLQVLKALPLQGKPIKPYIMQFNFGVADSAFKSIKAFSEIMEIFNATYNTRGGRADIGQYFLKQYVDNLPGGATFISLNIPLTIKKFPMNWVLSYTAVNRLEALIDSSLINPLSRDTTDSADKKRLKKLFLYH